MKQLLLATGLALASAAGASATVFNQVTSIKSEGNLDCMYIIPKDLVSVGSPRIFACEEDILMDSRTYILFDDSFQEIRRVIVPKSILELFFIDLNDNAISDHGCFLTQTLFNNDENYEYIVPIRDPSSDDIKGYQIVNEKGVAIAEITPPKECCNEHDLRLFKTETGFYFEFYSNSKYDGLKVIYKIDKETTSIQQVSAHTSKMDVNPRMVRQTPITVTLDENTDYTSIDLISMSGRIVQSVPVNNEKTISVDTSRLTHGVYIVKASGNNQSQETCKIVVQ